MASHEYPFNDTVHVVEFAPFEWCSHLLAVGTANRVIIAQCKFQVECPDVDGVEVEKIREFHHGTRVTCVAWSPETTIATIPKEVRLCTGGGDKRLRLFTSDLKEEDHIQELHGHTSYINDVAFDSDRGEKLASVSDDHTCRIWGPEGAQQAMYHLGSPGVRVCWHTEEPAKLMVAEKKGIIKFYNVTTHQPIMSLDCSQVPLLSADWSPGNSLHVAASTLADVLLFNTSQFSYPEESRQCHNAGTSLVRWSKSHDQLLGTLGRPGPQVKVTNVRGNKTPLSISYPIIHHLSWHLHLPLLAIAGDRKVHFHMLDSI